MPGFSSFANHESISFGSFAHISSYLYDENVTLLNFDALVETHSDQLRKYPSATV
jgi:hypothetical protein